MNFFLGMVVSCLLVFFLQYYLYGFNLEPTLRFLDLKTKLFLLQAMGVFILYLWLYFVSDSGMFATFFLFLLSVILGEITSQKLLLRGEPVYPSDIYFLKDVGFLIEMVDLRTSILIGTSVLVIISGSMFYFIKRKRPLKTLRQKMLRISGVFIASLLLFNLYQFNQPNNKIKAAFDDYTRWISYSQDQNYRVNGVVSGLLYNLKSPALDEPKNYSKNQIEEIYTKYSKEASLINEERSDSISETNIIYIMNESFSDAHRLDGVNVTGEDSLKNYRQLPGQHGNVLSQAYGGGTAYIEFEALTSISLEPLNGNITIPFIQLSQQMDKFPSITDFLKDKTHKRTAIHPYNTTMYKRVDNYQSLGFDHLIFQEDMRFTDTLELSHYISDRAAYEELKLVMEESDEKDFIHLVTMQNHMDYEGKYEEAFHDVTGTEKDVEVEYYLRGMQYSDEAIFELINYFEDFEEKVLLVFWGDHLPSIYGDEIYKLNGYQKMHETPLLIYSNYSEEKDNIGIVSPMYFMNHILKGTNSQVTPYVALLERLERALPAFEKSFYYERETGIKQNRSELLRSTQLLLEEYDLVLYDITTGKNYSKELGLY